MIDPDNITEYGGAREGRPSCGRWVMKGQPARRAADERAKSRARARLRARSRNSLGPRPPAEPTDRQVGRAAATPHPCSCDCCGNPRRRFKEPSRKEQTG